MARIKGTSNIDAKVGAPKEKPRGMRVRLTAAEKAQGFTLAEINRALGYDVPDDPPEKKKKDTAMKNTKTLSYAEKGVNPVRPSALEGYKRARRNVVPLNSKKFMLVRDDGMFLYFSGEGFTDKRPLAFWAISAQIDNMVTKRPDLRSLRRVPIN